MPVLADSSKVEKVFLPSTEKEEKEEDRAWVKMLPRIDVGLIVDGEQEGETDKGVAMSLRILSKAIVEWNYTDIAGAVLPISTENIRKIDIGDFYFLTQRFTSIDKITTEAKKKSDPVPDSPKEQPEAPGSAAV